MYDLSIDEIVLYTGRSLATFKRDFKKISTLSPQRWIMQKRLNVAYERIKTGGEKIADVCFSVGFKIERTLLPHLKSNLVLSLLNEHIIELFRKRYLSR
jgi:methylphosphotriester-DNA--protein-cysteine methyltransferase